MIAGWALAAALAAAPDRAPAGRQAVADLAYALGQIHGLSQVCLGEADQAWRERMNRLLTFEAPAATVDEPARRALIDRFNAGFALSRAEYSACTPEAEAARQAAARAGLSLSRQLGGE